MARRARLDAELVRRGLARSRDQASQLIAAGRVSVGGQTASKAATGVDPADPVLVAEDDGDPSYASRGGHKLAAALEKFSQESPPLRVNGRRCLDAGASTGGFTDVLLRAGASQVTAVDVGYGQLTWALQTDARVVVRDRTNVRHLDVASLGGLVELLVADLSFISLAVVLPSLVKVLSGDGDAVLLVKPQFEVGRTRLGQGGVVRDPALRLEAVIATAAVAESLGWRGRGVLASPLPGPAGNVEYLLWLTGPQHPGRPTEPLSSAAVLQAIEEGPQ